MERRRNEGTKSDRLSSLPDEVLCHVLSFLHTKFSVATSILAKRYRFLWRNVANLYFDYDLHPENSVSRTSFTDTINRVMLLRSNMQDINTFRLVINDEYFIGEQELDTWIRNAISRVVRAIDIELAGQVDTVLPYCLFTCETLVDLRLQDCGSVPDAIVLPNLKKLYLHNFLHGSDEKFQDLISGCPVLEELNIELIRDYDLEYCVISSPTIKWLSVEFDIENQDSDFQDFKLEIDTPALRYLDVADSISQHISAGILNSLVEASICLYNYGVVDDDICSDSVLEFVERLCQVKSLTLFSCHRKFRESSFAAAAATWKFVNLTKLELGADWLFLFKFLESADNLQVLIISKEPYHNQKSWMEPLQVPLCLSSHLRQVTVSSFGGVEDEFEMVSYFLKHGEVLNMMNVDAKYLKSNTKKLSALQRISEFERRSQTCKVKFLK